MTIKPLAIYSGKKVVFEVYRAKDLFKGSWASSKLRSLVIAARKISYGRYGKRPPLDKQDEKAAIYLVRARYRIKKLPVEEWLSVRMVPGDGSFLGVKEPEIFYYKNKPVDYLLRKRIRPKGKTDFWRHVASSSRMCGIHPFYGRRSTGLSEKHKYTGACFAIIHAQFLVDYPFKSFPYGYITATIRPDLLRKGLAVKAKKKIAYPFFLPAYKLLHIPRNHIGVDREVYAYDFPLYWLNARQMKTVVRNLVKNGILKEGAYLKKPFALIGAPLKNLNIKRKELFRIIDEKVKDATELKITPAMQWYRGIDRVLNAAEIEMPKFRAALKELKRGC